MVVLASVVVHAVLQQSLKLVNKLPFLKPKVLFGRTSKPVGTSKYGFTEEDDLKETSLKEMVEAYEAKDPSKMMSALEALVELIRNKEDAPDTQQAP